MLSIVQSCYQKSSESEVFVHTARVHRSRSIGLSLSIRASNRPEDPVSPYVIIVRELLYIFNAMGHFFTFRKRSTINKCEIK